jgi:hypothetical protein
MEDPGSQIKATAYATGIGRCIAALQEAVHQYATANREAGIPDDGDAAMKELRGYLVAVVRIGDSPIGLGSFRNRREVRH